MRYLFFLVNFNLSAKKGTSPSDGTCHEMRDRNTLFCRFWISMCAQKTCGPIFHVRYLIPKPKSTSALNHVITYLLLPRRIPSPLLPKQTLTINTQSAAILLLKTKPAAANPKKRTDRRTNQHRTIKRSTHLIRPFQW